MYPLYVLVFKVHIQELWSATLLGEGKDEDSGYHLRYWLVTKLSRKLPLPFLPPSKILFIRSLLSNGNFLDDGFLSIRNVQIP